MIASEIRYLFPLNSSMFLDFTILFDYVIGFEQFEGRIWWWCRFGANMENTKSNGINQGNLGHLVTKKKTFDFFLATLRHCKTDRNIVAKGANVAMLWSCVAHVRLLASRRHDTYLNMLFIKHSYNLITADS